MIFVRFMWLPTDDTSLSDVQSKLVLASLGQLAQLHAVDFGADEGGDMINLGLTLGQQVWECGIGVLAMIIVLEVLKRRIPVMQKSVFVQHL
jgi:hypothetical protein